MIALGYIISFFLGRLVIDRILKNDTHKILPLTVSLLALILGLGISGCLTFIHFLVFQKFSAIPIMTLNVSAMAGLAFWNRKIYKAKTIKPLNDWLPFKSFNGIICVYGVFAALIITLTYVICLVHPYGEWDAWAIWNLKTKFLILADSWHIIFNDLNYHTHPDYPLLLPLINTWLSCFTSGKLHPIPMITNILFVTGCGFFMGSILYQTGKKILAFFAGTLLLTIPSYLYIGTFQYADIVIAFFLLINMFLIKCFQDFRNNSWLHLCGMALGLMGFVKNEGFLMSLILFGLLTLYILTDKTIKTKIVFIQNLLAAFLLSSLPTFIFKLWIAPPNDDILPNVALSHLTVPRLNIFYKALLEEFMHEKWCYIWIVICVLFALKFFHLFKRKNLIFTVAFVLYMIAVSLIYLLSGKADLTWWLETSLSRIFFCLLPVLLYFGFTLQSENTITKS